MGILRPCHVAPASAISSSRLASSSPSLPGSLPILRPSPLKMQSGMGRLRHALRSQKGAADQPCEPIPRDDGLLPKDEFLKICRESMDKFEKEYSAAFRALYGPNQNNMMISEDRLFRDEKDRTVEYKREIDSNQCFLRTPVGLVMLQPQTIGNLTLQRRRVLNNPD